jgi:D-sedoheptulose 7-phosphate isomerase
MAKSDPRQEAVLAYLRRSQQAVERTLADEKFVAATVAIAERIAATLKSGGKVLLAGNGGSAADAQHIAAEFVGRFVDDRAPLAAIALTTDTSALTSIGNDYGFDKVFDRQVRALGRKGDVFIGISTSGRSPNVVAALQAARELGLTTIGFTRDAQTPMRTLCDLTLAVPTEETALIQQLHIAAAHAICHLVERELFGPKSDSKRG